MFQFCTYTFLTVLIVSLLATACDLTNTWSSPIFPKLHSTDASINPLNRPISSTEESWIGSLLNIGGILGPLPFGLLSKKLGRKVSLLCIAIPFIVSFFILAFLHNVYWYYTARIIAGISSGAGCSILPLYISEIAEESNRGMLTGLLNIFWTFGSLIPYIIGPYLDIQSFNATLAVIPTLFFFLFLVIGPESPYYLVDRNITKTEDSLMKLRSRSRSKVAKEIEIIQTTVRNASTTTFTALFRSKSTVKSLYISLALIAFQQLAGINAVLYYTQTIFEVVGSDLPPEISAIIVGLVLFFTSLIFPFIADRSGRRVFLIISSLGMMFSLACFAFQWLPVLTLVLFITFYNLGFAVLPWTVASELFPVNIKPMGIPLVSIFCFLSGFLVTRFFNDMNELVGKAGTFWIFAGWCLVATLFTVFLVPETKGKTFEEIREILEK